MLGARPKQRKGNYICPVDFVPVLRELLIPVGVLISRLCNQRNPFFPPSAESSTEAEPSISSVIQALKSSYHSH